MTEDEAEQLLSMYADGLLEEGDCREIEAVLAQSPRLKSELERMQALRKTGGFRPVSGRSEQLDDTLLTEALAPLRASRSRRIRVADAMKVVHMQAEHVADQMPDDAWRLFRICFSLLAVTLASIAWLRAPAEHPLAFTLVSWILFGLGLALTLGGRYLAVFESRALGLLSKSEYDPSRLEVLVLEVFGICCIIVAGVLYWLFL